MFQLKQWKKVLCFDVHEHILTIFFVIWNFETEGGMVVVSYFAPVCVKGSVACVYLQICDQTSQITLRHFQSFSMDTFVKNVGLVATKKIYQIK